MLLFKKYTSTIIIILGIILATIAGVLDFTNTDVKYMMILYILIIICFGTIFFKRRNKKGDE